MKCSPAGGAAHNSSPALPFSELLAPQLCALLPHEQHQAQVSLLAAAEAGSHRPQSDAFSIVLSLVTGTESRPDTF